MELKTKARLAMGAFLAACLIPSVGMVVLPERKGAANQVLAPPPKLMTEEGGLNPQVLQETTDYIADHFAFRQELITANAALDAALFRVSAEEKVLLGREGWLFYRETLDDWLHTRPMTQRQLCAAARTLGLMQEYAQDRGARFLFAVVPNKATLYPQYLPYAGQPLEGEGDLDRLLPLLEGEGVPEAGLREAFQAQDGVLYFRLDSHWTAQGAALAQQTLLSALDREFIPFWGTASRSVQTHRGDLYEMLYPTGKELDWDVEYQRPFTFTYTRPFRSPEDQRIETQCAGKTGTLLMFRDSFGNNLHPFLAEEFGQAVFSRSMPYRLTLLEETGADTVVVELVERNLDYLAFNPPVFPAPERLLSGTPPEGEGWGTLAPSEASPLEGYVRLEGLLTGPIDPDSPIYVQLDGTLYEASPGGAGWEEGVPFTLYVPQDAPREGGSVLCFQDGALCALPLTFR